jgi:hypothetical protein
MEIVLMTISQTLMVGDRVRVTPENRTPGFRPGDKGTVFGVYIIPDGVCYRVAIDRNGPSAKTVIFSEDELESDV